MRKENREISGDDLADQLEVARYLCMSHGESTLTTDMWIRAVEMEQERHQRLNMRLP